MSPHCRAQQLHGFADASERAFAAVVYLRVELPNDQNGIQLISARTRLAPTKTVSLPRLELCGALLLAQLINKIAELLQLPPSSCYCWSDSKITLAWIASPASRWQTFVANRVAEIQTLTNPTSWRHVTSAANPADCASRGMKMDELRTHDLWWNDPSFLNLSPSQWENERVAITDTTLEVREKTVSLHTTEISTENELLLRFSDIFRLLLITAYAHRWAQRIRGTIIPTVEEIQRARIR